MQFTIPVFREAKMPRATWTRRIRAILESPGKDLLYTTCLEGVMLESELRASFRR